MKKLWSIMCLACVLHPAMALAQTIHSISLQEALREAELRNATVLAARTDVEAAKARFEQASLNPLQLQGSVNSAPDSPQGVNTLQTTAVGLEQQLGNIGALGATRRIGSAAVTVAEAKLAGVRRDVAQNVVVAYYTLANALGASDLAKSGVEITQRLRDNAVLRQRVGAVGSFEVLRANVELQRARSESVRADGNVRAARFALNAILGRPIEDPTAVLLPDSALSASASDLIATIVRADPQVAELQATVAEAEARESLARSSRAPALTLGAGVQAIRAKSVGQTNVGPALTATLSIPMYDHGSIRGAIREAQAARTAAEQLLVGRRLEVESQLATAVSDIQSAQSRLQGARDSQHQAAEGLRIAQYGYRRGALSTLDVLAARNADLTARADLNQALTDLASAVARLRILRGDF